MQPSRPRVRGGGKMAARATRSSGLFGDDVGRGLGAGRIRPKSRKCSSELCQRESGGLILLVVTIAFAISKSRTISRRFMRVEARPAWRWRGVSRLQI